MAKTPLMRQIPAPPMMYGALMQRGAASVRFYESGDGLTAIVTDERYLPDGSAGRHVSFSRPKVDPTWTEMRDALYEVCGEETFMAMILPPLEQFGTLPGSHVFHWFEVPLGTDTAFLANLQNWL